MKTIIVYYSFSGNNALLASELQTRMNCDMIQVHETNKRRGVTILLDVLFNRMPRVIKPKLSLSEYERVIFLAPIWAGRVASPMRAFIRMEKDMINTYAFITLCGDGGNTKIYSDLHKITGKKPVSVTELRVADLLKMRNTRKFTSSYHVTAADMEFFRGAIDRFLHVQNVARTS